MSQLALVGLFFSTKPLPIKATPNSDTLSLGVDPRTKVESFIPTCERPLVTDAKLATLADRLCSCQTMWTHHLNPLATNGIMPAWSPIGQENSIKECRGVVEKASNQTIMFLNEQVSSWGYSNGGFDTRCRFSKSEDGEAALKETVQSRGDPRRLARAERKLATCGDGDAVSIVIFGGSETGGHSCQGKHPTWSDYLGLPSNLSLTELIMGNDVCPWANRLKFLLSEKYPRCSHIDVYNLAAGATDLKWVCSALCYLCLALLLWNLCCVSYAGS